MTADIDWNGAAKLLERQDGGSELYVEFTTLRSGALSALVADVASMGASERARLLIDAGPAGMFGSSEIVALAGRADFPG